MAGGDYRSCDVCGRKAFYDANLNHEFDGIAHTEGVEENGTPAGYTLDYLGAWAVLCSHCAEAHTAVVVPREARPAKTQEALDHLRVALKQVAPSDDEIIVGHMRDALAALESTP